MGDGPGKRKRVPPAWLRALGRGELPERVEIEGRMYRRVTIFKHDFFAATGKYLEEGQSENKTIVLKVYRVASLFGLPMRWSGRWQMRHEARMYRLLAEVAGVPRFCGEVGETGFAHAYVEGHPLGRGESVDDAFFPRLAGLLDAVHALGAAYVDLEKRENILVGDDGRPWLIDFQISFHWPWRFGAAWWPVRAVRGVLQRGDRYHLLKHKRRLRPDQLTDEERQRAAHVPFLVRMHRVLFRPFTVVRRRVLVIMGARKGTGREGEKQDVVSAES